MNIKNYRDELNNIDDNIAKLYKQRMQLSQKIGEYKKANNLPLVNYQRELEILNRIILNFDEDLKLYAKQLFEYMFDSSKSYQLKYIDQKATLAKEITNSIEENKKFPISASVACQGIEGAYSSVASRKLFEVPNITYFKSFKAVFTAVENGLCQYGVLPIENSSVGSVNAIYDLMALHKFYIVKAYKLRVQHALLAKNNISFDEIEEILSHEQALEQCSYLLSKIPNAKITIVENTAEAAKIVSSSSKKIACISSRECSSLYNLKVLKSNVQDNDSNFTRFIVVSDKMEIFSNSNKISIMVNLPHTSGSLNKLLNEFSIRGLNLSKLESRPQPNSSFEFTFYFDFDANMDNDIVKLLSYLENNYEEFKFLGSYSEA